MSSYLICHKSFRRLSFAFTLAVLLALLVASPVWAIAIRGDDTITIGNEEVIDDDLLLGGNIVVVNGVVNGDLVAAGSQVIINGEVKGSLLFAGQILVLNGKVDGAVYSGGTSLTVGPNAEVGRNLIFGGYSYRAEPGSSIGRDTIIGGYQAVLDGKIERNVYAALAALELNGNVGGNVEATVDAPGSSVDLQFVPGFGGQPMPPPIQTGLRIGPEAKIAGKLSYTSVVDQSDSIASEPGGGIVHMAPPPGTAGTAPVPVTPAPTEEALQWFWMRVRELVTLFAIGVLVLWLMPALFNQIGERSQDQPLLAGAWGILVAMIGYGGALLLTLLLIFIVAGFASLTLAGLSATLFSVGFSALGLGVSIFSVLVAYVSKVVVVYPLSHAMLERYLPQWTHYKVVPLFLGTLLFVLLRSIPWLGTLISIGVTLVGLGAMWLVFRDRFTKTKEAAPQLVLTPA